MTDLDPTSLSATDLAQRIARREVSCTAVMTAFLDRIAAITPRVNAIVSRVGRPALLARAAEYDRCEPKGPLHGLPFAVKDLEAVAGLPNTMGSPLFRD